ncbi:MAG: hypothetical protein Q9170_006431 [Blastenia crenularia]
MKPGPHTRCKTQSPLTPWKTPIKEESRSKVAKAGDSSFLEASDSYSIEGDTGEKTEIRNTPGTHSHIAVAPLNTADSHRTGGVRLPSKLLDWATKQFHRIRAKFRSGMKGHNGPFSSPHVQVSRKHRAAEDATSPLIGEEALQPPVGDRDLAPDGQSSQQSQSNDFSSTCAVGKQTVPPGISNDPCLDESSSSEPTIQADDRDFDWKFRIVIHSPKGDKQRVACLDTGSEIDVVGHHVVDELGLQREPYHGGPLSPVGDPFTPQSQVTFDWHVSKFTRTFSTTFAVLGEEHSREFDVLLGRITIEKYRFFHRNKNLFMLATADDDSYPIKISEKATE